MDYDNNEDRSIIMSEVMTPEKANFAGNIHGGHLLSLLDKVAYACAARYAGQYVVTLSVDDVFSKNPFMSVSWLCVTPASIMSGEPLWKWALKWSQRIY